MTNYLTLDDIRLGVYNYVKVNLEFDEPIPSYKTANVEILKGILSSLNQTLNGKDAYPTLTHKASVLFYRMIKNHPFLNGNKRIAIVSLFLFLAKNGKWLSLPIKELYTLSKNVAQSDPRNYISITDSISDVIKKHLVDFS